MHSLEPHTAVEVRTIFDAVEARIPSRLKLAAKLTSEYSNATLHNMTVGNVMGGMRGLPAMLWEVSGTEKAGITYHGKSLHDLLEILPKWRGSGQVCPEAMLWYLYTGTVPTRLELETFAADLARRGDNIPPDVEELCDSLSPDTASTAQLIMCLSVWSPHSKFAAALVTGVPRSQLWRYALEDALDSHVCIPLITARIYANKYRDGRDRTTPLNPTGDIAHNFAIRMGRTNDEDFTELIRMYWALHMDHGANVSAHTMRLSSSAWTDPYLTMASGLISGTGILHAGAIMQALRYNQAMSAVVGEDPTSEAVEAYICRTLEKGHVVPGYGHALLRGADPRLEPITRFINTRSLPPSASSEKRKMLKLIGRTSTIVPDILRRHVPRMKSTAPNVDSLSGCLMYIHGLDIDFILLVMGCSRGMGFMAQYVWDRALGLPIERPLSITMDQIMARL
ncbi:hypothetical protein AcV7_005775 [Taiwanofungus camphoratus]|nr:hypothetical protein AcV7_005775 [Antrodia cinnamomea]